MPHINYRDEKMVLKFRTRHMPTKEHQLKGNKGAYNRSAAKAEMDEYLDEYEQYEADDEEASS